MTTLRVIAGPHHGAVFELIGDRITIGRDLDNTIRLPDSLVSRHHAEILRDGTTYKIRDLNSTNGSFVNGNRVVESALKTGEKLRLADVEFAFESQVDAPVEVVPPPGATPAPTLTPPSTPAVAPAPAVRQVETPLKISPPPDRGVWRPPQPPPQPPQVPPAQPMKPAEPVKPAELSVEERSEIALPRASVATPIPLPNRPSSQPVIVPEKSTGIAENLVVEPSRPPAPATSPVQPAEAQRPATLTSPSPAKPAPVAEVAPLAPKPATSPAKPGPVKPTAAKPAAAQPKVGFFGRLFGGGKPGPKPKIVVKPIGPKPAAGAPQPKVVLKTGAGPVKPGVKPPGPVAPPGQAVPKPTGQPTTPPPSQPILAPNPTPAAEVVQAKAVESAPAAELSKSSPAGSPAKPMGTSTPVAPTPRPEQKILKTSAQEIAIARTPRPVSPDQPNTGAPAQTLPASTPVIIPPPGAYRHPGPPPPARTQPPQVPKPKSKVRVIDSMEQPLPGPPEPQASEVQRPPVPRTIRKVIAPEGWKTDPVEVVEEKKFNRAYFAILLFIGLLLLIAGYSLTSNALRFFGLVFLITGILCIAHDWSPLPAKPPRTV